MEFDSQFIQIGSVQIRYYGIIIVTAMIAATFVALNLATRTKRDPEHIYGALTWAIIPGIIAARLWFVMFPPVSSVNTFVPLEKTYDVPVAALIDESGQAVGELTPFGLQVTGLVETDGLAEAGLQDGDQITAVRLPDADEFTPVADTTSLAAQLSTLDADAEVRVRVERDVPKDRNFYLENFFDLDNGAIAIWSGGLSIFGALLGGLAGAYLYLRKNGLPIGPWLDIGAVVLPLAQAIGRWANYVNQELFGTSVNADYFLALRIPEETAKAAIRAAEGLPPDASIPGSYLDAIVTTTSSTGAPEVFYTFHPLFLYESVWSFLAFGVLLWVYLNYRDRFRPGDFFLMYLAQYSFIRFWLEGIRLEVTTVGDVNLSQAVTLVTFVLSLALLAYRVATRSQDERSYAEIAPPVWPEKPKDDPAPKSKKEKKAPKAKPAAAAAGATGGSASVTGAAADEPPADAPAGDEAPADEAAADAPAGDEAPADDDSADESKTE